DARPRAGRGARGGARRGAPLGELRDRANPRARPHASSSPSTAARAEPGARRADLRRHRDHAVLGLRLGVHDHARLGGALAGAGPAAPARRGDGVQHAAPARERRRALARPAPVPALPGERAGAAARVDPARRRLRGAPGPRVGEHARAGADAPLERARQLLLPDRRLPRAARGGRDRDPDLGVAPAPPRLDPADDAGRGRDLLVFRGPGLAGALLEGLPVVTKGSALIAARGLALPPEASACDLCTSAQDATVQAAFAVASLFMTLMPLGVVGGLVWFLRRRAEKLRAEEAAGVVRLPLASDRSLRRS